MHSKGLQSSERLQETLAMLKKVEEEAREELKRAEEEGERIIEEAKREAKEILIKAREEAERKKQEYLADERKKVEKEVEEILIKAREEAERIRGREADEQFLKELALRLIRLEL